MVEAAVVAGSLQVHGLPIPHAEVSIGPMSCARELGIIGIVHHLHVAEPARNAVLVFWAVVNGAEPVLCVCRGEQHMGGCVAVRA